MKFQERNSIEFLNITYSLSYMFFFYYLSRVFIKIFNIFLISFEIKYLLLFTFSSFNLSKSSFLIKSHFFLKLYDFWSKDIFLFQENFENRL